MGLPESLHAIVNRAKKQVEADPKGMLRLGLRQLIWNELGIQERKKECRAVHHIGLKRRFHLARSCAERVLPYWQAVFANDDMPAKLLQMADDYVAGNDKYGPTRKKWIDSAGAIEWYISEHAVDNDAAILAGCAAHAATFVALFDDQYDADSINPELSDLDVDNSKWDASFTAAESYAKTNGLTEEEHKLLRIEFWIWYLEEAVPSAWNSQSNE